MHVSDVLKEPQVHRWPLANASPVFHALLQKDPNCASIDLSQLGFTGPSATMECFLRLLYNEMLLLPSTMQESVCLAYACDWFQVPPVFFCFFRF